MKQLIIPALLIALAFTGCSKKNEDGKDTGEKKLSKKEADIDVLSYRMGFDSTIVTIRNFPEANADAICRGVKDAFEKPMEPQYGDTVFNAALANYRKDKIKIDSQKRLSEFIVNKPVSEKFMAENAKKKGIKKFDNGILLEVIKEGAGEPMTMNDIIEIHYQAWDAKNKLFDSSYKRNRPSRFNPNELVKGLTFGLQQMKKGGKYRLYIPQEMGYGSTGNKDRVESGMALLFEIDVLNIERGRASATGGEKK
ncbi:MAG TPA: FKBP-type peptidyl-prolyl cis-trans isomerase [bacterium]|nr:FKBP-type peptidyl-prolyl cis-trans isomerase [bacterium]